jgi:hypothetical protein
MEEKELVGFFEFGLSIFGIFNIGVTLPLGGGSAYDNCDRYQDGTLCLLGSTCNNCMNPPSKYYDAFKP